MSGGGAASWSCGASSPLSREASGSPLGNPGTSPRSPRTSSLGGSSPSRGGFSLMPTTPEPASPHRSAGYSPPSSRQGQRAAEGTATDSPQPPAPPQHEVEQAEEEILLSPESSKQLLSAVRYTGQVLTLSLTRTQSRTLTRTRTLTLTLTLTRTPGGAAGALSAERRGARALAVAALAALRLGRRGRDQPAARGGEPQPEPEPEPQPQP